MSNDYFYWFGFDAALVRVFVETCERTGGEEWLKWQEQDVPKNIRSPGTVMVPSTAAAEAIERYRKLRCIKYATKPVGID